jgi:DNA-binding LytR/AlgR family response regulator
MRILITDPNENDLCKLRTILAAYPGIRGIDWATDLEGAKRVLATNEFEIAFIDAGLGDPGDLVDSMQHPPHVVLMGGEDVLFDEQELAQPSHWIAKPICERTLLLCLLRVACSRNNSASAVSGLTHIKKRPQRHRLCFSSIIAVEARGNYSNVLCGSNELFDRCQLRQWQTLLSGYGFTRLDRSTLVRLDKVHSWTLEGKGASVSFIKSPLKIKIGDVALQRLSALIPPPNRAANKQLGVVSREPARR